MWSEWSRRYHSLFLIPGVSRLMWSVVVARLPLGMSSLSILLLIHANTGSFGDAGLCVGGFAIAGGLLAPVQGTLVDRFGQFRVLMPCAVGQSILFVALAAAVEADLQLAWILAICVAIGALIPPLAACVRSLWPAMIPSSADLQAAYALDATMQEAVWVVGPLLVSVILIVGSPTAAVLAIAVLTLAGTCLFALNPRSRSWRGDWSARPATGALTSPTVRLVVLAIGAIGLHIGALEVTLPAFMTEHGANSSSGLPIACWAGGSLVGGLVFSVRLALYSAAARHVCLLLVLSCLTAPLFAADTVPKVLILVSVAGLPGALVLTSQYTLISEFAPSGTLAEAFTWCTAALLCGTAFGQWAAAALLQRGGVDAALLAGVLAPLLGAGPAAAILARRDRGVSANG